MAVKMQKGAQLQSNMRTVHIRRYAAFISYSHALDGAVAAAVQHSLQVFAKPWYKARNIRVFRDQTNLSMHSDLWHTIQKALDQSAFFVLMASPDAASSAWVNRELVHWLKGNPSSRLLIVLTSGSIAWDAEIGDFDWQQTSAMPPTLSHVFDNEPQFVDLSWVSQESDQLTLRNPRYLDVIHSLAAAIHGAEKDEIASLYARQRRRTFATVSLATGLIVAGLLVSVAMTYLYDVERKNAESRRQEAERQRQIAVSRQFAVQSELSRSQGPNLLPRSVLLAIESMRLNVSAEGEQSLRSVMRLLPLPTLSVLHEGRNTHLNDVKFSPDGKYLATGSSGGDHTARLWNTMTGKEVARMEHRSWVNFLVFSPNGHILASGEPSSDGVILWEANSGKAIARLQLGYPKAIAFSPDGRFLVGVGESGKHYTTVLWDVLSGQELFRKTYETSINTVAFSPNSEQIASGGEDRTLRIWDIKSGKETMQRQHSAEIKYLTYSPNGNHIAVATVSPGGGVIIVWEISSGQEIGRIGHGTSIIEVPSVVFSPDGAFLAIAGGDNSAWLWKVNTRQEVMRFKHGSQVKSVEFNPDGTLLSTLSNDNTARVWSISNGQELFRIVHETSLAASAFSPDSNYLATASKSDGRAWIWKLLNHGGGKSRSYPAKPNVLTVSSDGKTLATGSDDGIARLWDASSGQELLALPHPGSSNVIDSIAFSINGNNLITSSWDKTARIWNILNAEEISRVDTTGGYNTGIVSPDGNYVAMSQLVRGAPYFDSATFVWQMSNGEKIVSLTYSTGSPRRPSFSLDGRFLAVINNQARTLLILDIANNKQIESQEFSSDIEIVSFSSDSRSTVITDQAGKIHMLDVATGHKIREMSHSRPIKMIFYGSYDDTLISSDDAGGLQLWNSDSGEKAADIQYNVEVVAMAVSPGGRYIATATKDNSVQISQQKDLQPVHVLKHNDTVRRLAFSPDGHYLATQTEFMTQLWKTTSGKAIFNVSSLASNRALAFSPTGNYLTTAVVDGTARIYKIPAGEQISAIKHQGNPASIRHAIFSQDSRYLVTGSSGLGNSAHVWDISAGQELMRFKKGGLPYALAFSPDGQTIAIYDTESDSIILRNIPKHQETGRWKTEGGVTELAFSPDGRYLAATTRYPENATLVWNLTTREEIFRVAFHANAVSFSPDSRYLAAVTSQGNAQVFEFVRDKEVFNISQQQALVDVAFSADGRYLATASTNHTAKIWELNSGKNLTVLTHTSIVRSVAFTNQGNTLITLTDDGKMWTWPLGTEDLIADACSRLTRNFTWREWQQYMGSEKPYRRTCSDIPAHPSVIDKYVHIALDFANNGEIADTQSWISKTRELNPSLDVQALVMEIGHSLIAQGKHLASTGDISNASEKFSTAKILGRLYKSDLESIAQQDESKAIGMSLNSQGIKLAEAENIKAATDKFKAAAKMLSIPDDFDPEASAKYYAAQAMIINGVKLSEQGQILQALATIEKAKEYDPSLEPSADSWNSICWLGSIKGYAKNVLDSCDRAVTLNPDIGYYYDSRGLARALTGNYKGAMEDFSKFIDWAKKKYSEKSIDEGAEELLNKRKKWFKQLSAGKNPFDRKTIEALQNE